MYINNLNKFFIKRTEESSASKNQENDKVTKEKKESRNNKENEKNEIDKIDKINSVIEDMKKNKYKINKQELKELLNEFTTENNQENKDFKYVSTEVGELKLNIKNSDNIANITTNNSTVFTKKVLLL